MSEFIAGFVPILVMWALPLAPMLYAAIAAIAEGLAKPIQGEHHPSRTTATSRVRLGARQPADPSSGDQQAA